MRGFDELERRLTRQGGEESNKPARTRSKKRCLEIEEQQEESISGRRRWKRKIGGRKRQGRDR